MYFAMNDSAGQVKHKLKITSQRFIDSRYAAKPCMRALSLIAVACSCVHNLSVNACLAIFLYALYLLECMLYFTRYMRFFELGACPKNQCDFWRSRMCDFAVLS